AIDVRADVKIEVAVRVGIEECGAGIPRWRFQADLRSYVLERSVATIAIEDVGPEVGDEEIRAAIGAGICDADATPPAPFAADPGPFGHIFERSVRPAAIERVAAAFHDLRS